MNVDADIVKASQLWLIEEVARLKMRFPGKQLCGGGRYEATQGNE